MDEGLRSAARSGNIDDLYALIQVDTDVFRRVDQMEFVDTPLHVAAAAGHTDFAMEVMNLKPSFARKLNQQGFSPIHLALQNQQTETVIDLLSVDKDLARVKGREGYSPFHYAALEGDVHLLSHFLDRCHGCILDLTSRKQNALHIAAQKNRFEAFKAILQWIQRAFKENDQFQICEILNLQDKDGNTVLHIAASNNQTQMIKLLINCKEVDKSKINRRGFTALDVLQRQTLVDTRESVKILSRAPSRKVSRSEALLTDYIRGMKPETINALLVVLSLVLTMTYQAMLSPPRGILPGDADPAAGNSNKNGDEGKSDMSSLGFLLFYIPNGMAFLIAFTLTTSLLDAVANSIKSFLSPLYRLMCFSFGVGMAILAPSTTTGLVVVGSFIGVYLIYCICLFRFGGRINGDV